MNEKMVLALMHNSLDDMRNISKSDLHSHGARGGHVSYIANWAGIEIEPPPKKFISKEDESTTLASMQKWFKKTIRPHCIGPKGHLKRWEATFAQATEDNISIMSISFRRAEIFKYFSKIENFIKTIQELQQKFAPNTILLPELAYAREDCDVDTELPLLEEIVSHNFFKSIDICGDEHAQPIRNFKKIYNFAKSSGLILKAHVGEFGKPDDIMEAVEELELDEVHHGNAAEKSPRIMKWLAANQIQLNVCPTSNIMLGLVEDYSTHPIKQFYEYGIPVTINTDDLLIFNQTVSQEYLNLYNAKTLNAQELDNIRERGLSAMERYNIRITNGKGRYNHERT